MNTRHMCFWWYPRHTLQVLKGRLGYTLGMCRVRARVCVCVFFFVCVRVRLRSRVCLLLHLRVHVGVFACSERLVFGAAAMAPTPR